MPLPTAVEKTTATNAASKFALPKLAGLDKTLPQVPDFKNGVDKQTDSNAFAYAPIDKLREALRTETNRIASPQASDSKFAGNPVNNTIRKAVAKTPELISSAPQRSAFAIQPTRVPQRSSVGTFAEVQRPTMKTEVSVPQAPIMVEGVVQIAETITPSVEGRLVAAEQPLNESSLVRNSQSQDTIQKQISRTDRLLENVNFFKQDDEPAQSAPNTFAIPGQPVPQSQIVINLNAGNAAVPQAPQATNQAVIIQPNFSGSNTQPSHVAQSGVVAQASSTVAVADRAKISDADISFGDRIEVRSQRKVPSHFAVEGTLGRWKKRDRLRSSRSSIPVRNCCSP